MFILFSSNELGGSPSDSYTQISYLSIHTSSCGMKTSELNTLMSKSRCVCIIFFFYMWFFFPHTFCIVWWMDHNVHNLCIIIICGCRYLSIIKEEGLEISQPALNPEVSEVHHDLTATDTKFKVHRSFPFYPFKILFSRLSPHLYKNTIIYKGIFSMFNAIATRTHYFFILIKPPISSAFIGSYHQVSEQPTNLALPSKNSLLNLKRRQSQNVSYLKNLLLV